MPGGDYPQIMLIVIVMVIVMVTVMVIVIVIVIVIAMLLLLLLLLLILLLLSSSSINSNKLNIKNNVCAYTYRTVSFSIEDWSRTGKSSERGHSKNVNVSLDRQTDNG